jgi:hypothetical protein
MSYKATTWAWQQQLVALDKLVLLALADRHNTETGRCDPSVSRIAKDCGMSTRSVQNSIKSLQTTGLLIPTPRKVQDKNLSNLYTLHLYVNPEVVQDVHGAGRAVVQEVHQGGAADAPGVVQDVHQTGAGRAPEPVIELVIEPGREPKDFAKPKASRNKAVKQLSFSDSRFTPFREAFGKYYQHKVGAPAPWEAKEATQLSRWLKANPTITLEQWQTLLQHRNKSPVNHATPLSSWIGKALTWLEKPQDDFGREVRNGAVSHSKTGGNLAVVRRALAGRKHSGFVGENGNTSPSSAGRGNAGPLLFSPTGRA